MEGGELPVDEEYFLWPENLPIWNLWLGVQTQWRIDDGARRGLDYQGVQMVMHHWAVPKKDKSEYFRMLQVMEFAALDEWSNQG